VAPGKRSPLGANLGPTVQIRHLGTTLPRTGPGSRTGENARSGPSLPEDERDAKIITARLAPEAREALDAVATRWGLSRSATIARLAVEALARRE